MIAEQTLPIMLIESHSGLLLDLNRAMVRLGFEVDAYADMSAAAIALLSSPTRLIVADLDSPGVEDWLSTDERTRSWPRILLGNAGSTSRRVVSATDRIVSKPFAIRELAAAVQLTMNAHYSRHGSFHSARDPLLETEDSDFEQLLGRARRYAEGSASIRISGEYGTGRMALARAIHDWCHHKAGDHSS